MRYWHMRYDGPERKSTRLRGYNYAEPGWYFITICTYQRERLLSAIQGGCVEHSAFGSIVDLCWRGLTSR
jgi:putative transposase